LQQGMHAWPWCMAWRLRPAPVVMPATQVLAGVRVSPSAARTCPQQQVVQLLVAAVRALHGAVHREELEAERRGGVIHVGAVQGHAVW
jgi:hypothetical protein